MKLTADTNLLVRVVVQDDPAQARAAMKVLEDAELVIITGACLCEFVWVLRRFFKFKRSDISSVLRGILNAANVVVARPAVDAGLAVLDAGGDFADGMIAHEGAWLGGETFISFDKRAVSLVERQGYKAQLLTA